MLIQQVGQSTSARHVLEGQTAILAFDVGGTRIKVGLVRGAEILALHVEPLNQTGAALNLVQILVELGECVRGDVPVQAVGISLKGIVNPRQGSLLDVNETWAHLIGQDFVKPLSDAFGLPVFVENDARMYTVGELLYGAGRDVNNMLCLTLGTGIGSGVALHRRVLRGSGGCSGILGGHITVQVDGPRCTCGNIGCLEAFIGAAPLVRKAAELVQAQDGKRFGQALLTPRAIFTNALEGDAVACEVVAYFTRYLSAGVVSLIHAYHPELVVLGGGIAEASSQFLPALQNYVNEHTWTVPRGSVRVARAELGDAAALLGIAALARGLDIFLE